MADAAKLAMHATMTAANSTWALRTAGNQAWRERGRFLLEDTTTARWFPNPLTRYVLESTMLQSSGHGNSSTHGRGNFMRASDDRMICESCRW